MQVLLSDRPEKLYETRRGAGTLRRDDVKGDRITVSGWVYRYRDQGGVLFVDLRDRSGIVQLVFEKSNGEELLSLADNLRAEDVILAEGVLRERSKDAVNPKLATGEIELVVQGCAILSKSKPSPIPLEEHEDEASEEHRLKFRYLDMRRAPLQETLRQRHRFTNSLRSFLDDRDFWEVETPILNKSTPEGARDFLVPSRLNAGDFYALPQSPQIFKQILMIGQVEKYFQIARCFRDEDLRKDRQPEFTQLDIEMSFISQNMIMNLMEEMIRKSMKDVFGHELPATLKRLSYKDAMENYGSDKPDLRFEMPLVELGDWAATTEFKVFRQVVDQGGRLKALCVPGGASLSRKDIDDLTHWVNTDFKAKGLAWIKFGESGLESVITKFLPEAAQLELIRRCKAVKGDIIFFAADAPDVVFGTLSALRNHLAAKLGMIPENTWNALWVVDFPLFEIAADTGELNSLHHPFTSPVEEDKKILMEISDIRNLTKEDKTKLASVRSNAYDFVLNGVEIGGGSIRIHDSDLQKRIFQLLNITDEEVESRFGFMVEALKFGAPPHGGIAFGIDRILMLALGRNSIRDVIAFPKTQKGVCLMSQAPSGVDEKQLRDLRLRSLVQPKEAKAGS